MASNVNQIDKSALVYVKEIGEGGFSNVYEMTWKSPNGPVQVAAKKLHRKDRHELEVLSQLEHPNIVKIIGVVDEEMDFMLILELCEGGSLKSYLRARNGRRLSTKQFFDWAEQAAKPLEYLREKKLVHKDLKSDNYMVTSMNTLKLGDFGIAKNIDHTIDNATTTASIRWMAPELLIEFVLSPKFDIFALAVVLWELWTGRYPWEGLGSQTIKYKVCMANERLPIPEDCPEPIKDLLTQCWKADWKQRPDILQVLQVITSAAAATLRTSPSVATASAAALPLPPPAIQARQKQIIAGPWKMVRKFGQLDGPGKLIGVNHMTLSPGGDVVITDYAASDIKIYTIEGKYKSAIKTPKRVGKFAVSADNTCFVTHNSEYRYITMYELSGKCKGSWKSSRIHPPSSIAIDKAGDLLLGDIGSMCIHKHRSDGTYLGRISVGIEPRSIAVTSEGAIVIADRLTALLISRTGEVLHTLKHPEVEPVRNAYVNCYNGIIFVAQIALNYPILCHSESGEYLGSIPIPDIYPHGGIAMTPDSKTLLVCQIKSVKVYTNSSIQ